MNANLQTVGTEFCQKAEDDKYKTKLAQKQMVTIGRNFHSIHQPSALELFEDRLAWIDFRDVSSYFALCPATQLKY